MELFAPADDEYIKELSKIDVRIALTMSSESGVDRIRGAHGRKYSNDAIYNTIELCKKYNISLGMFSMIALANDTPETVKMTWDSWEQICLMNVNKNVPVDYAFGPMVLLDPGSLAFDRPTSYGYRLVFKDLEDYVRGMSLPSWHQWVSYETKFLDKDQIVELTIDSLEYSINLRERAGFFSKSDAEIARFCYVETDKEVIARVNEAMKIDNEDEREKVLKTFRESLDNNLDSLISKQDSTV